MPQCGQKDRGIGLSASTPEHAALGDQACVTCGEQGADMAAPARQFAAIFERDILRFRHFDAVSSGDPRMENPWL